MDITSFASKSSYCSKDAPQKSKSELSPYVWYDRCIWLPAFFSYFFYHCLSLTLLHARACLHLLWRQEDWMKTSDFSIYVNHSLVVLILCLFFMLLANLCQWLHRIGLWGRMCDPYVKEVFSQRFHSPPAKISNPALSAVLTFLS